MRRRSLTAAAALSVIAIGIGWLMAEELNEEPAATFFEPLRVPLVSVDVLVTDKAGVPILGLTREDFEVFEDDAPVEITHFFAANPEMEPIDNPGRLQYLPESFRQDVYLALFFDDSNISRQRRSSILHHLRDFLKQPLPPNLQTMLVRFDGSLHVEVGFSDRPDKLIPAIERIMDEPPVTIVDDGAAIIRRMQAVAGSFRPKLSPPPTFGEPQGRPQYEGVDTMVMENSAFLPVIRDYAASQNVRYRASLEALGIFVDRMVGIRGRKVVLWVGDLEMRTGENVFRVWQELFPDQARRQPINPSVETNQYDLSRDLRELADRANNHRVSFYTLGSLAASIGTSASSNQRILETSGRPGQQTQREIPGQNDALMVMSNLTGGAMLADNAELDEQLDQVANELGTYYSLAYTPPSPGDGKQHRIKIKVGREGARLRYRLGYRDTGEKDRTADRTLAAGMLGVADNPLGIKVVCQEQEPQGENTYLVPVMIRIPIGELVLLPEEGRHRAQISVFSVVFDEAGRSSDVHERSYPIEIQNDQMIAAVEQEAKFVVGMVLREGRHRVAVSIRDDRSSSESTAFVDVVVGTGVENAIE